MYRDISPEVSLWSICKFALCTLPLFFLVLAGLIAVLVDHSCEFVIEKLVAWIEGKRLAPVSSSTRLRK